MIIHVSIKSFFFSVYDWLLIDKSPTFINRICKHLVSIEVHDYIFKPVTWLKYCFKFFIQVKSLQSINQICELCWHTSAVAQYVSEAIAYVIVRVHISVGATLVLIYRYRRLVQMVISIIKELWMHLNQTESSRSMQLIFRLFIKYYTYLLLSMCRYCMYDVIL